MESVFKIENVNLFYGEKQALKNINLDLYKNQVTAFIGPSGCGKSTFLRCINLLETPDEGELDLDGLNILDKKCLQRFH